MTISGIHTTKPRTQRYVEAFVKGSGSGKIYQFRDLKKLPNENLTMYGILAGSGKCTNGARKKKEISISWIMGISQMPTTVHTGYV